MPSLYIDLNDDERKVLRTLARGGTMSPSVLSVETLILPGQALALLEGLTEKGLVMIRQDVAETADRKLVALTAEARNMMGPEAGQKTKR